MIVHMIGNAHLDPVWLWPWQAGVDEALASFRSAADRCDEYPEFIYTRGEAWLYQQVERIDPALFERVRRLVERGQWHVTGGQYIQPDTNLPTEMGLNRQFIHGRRYFKDRFGVGSQVAYNVDSFGHPATLPDILTARGYMGYVFHRPNANQVELPAQTFRWRGVRGGEVIGFRIEPVYLTRSDDLYGQIMLSVDAADEALGHTMCFYGIGNHGGGPTKANIEYILEHEDAFEDIELRFSTPERFFEAILPRIDDLPVVTKELQRTFPGCYSAMHDIKQNQRQGEYLLDRCERVIEQLSSDTSEQRRLRERLDQAWEDLLFTQFHDILAGTSIPSAWSSVRAMQGRARITAEEIIVEVTRRWSRRSLPEVNHQQISIMNTGDSTYASMIETEPFLDFAPWGDRWLSDLEGSPVEFQLVQPEAPTPLINRVVFPARVPAHGCIQVLVRDDPKPALGAIATDLSVTPEYIANSRLRIELNSSGISSISADGHSLLGKRGINLQLRRDSSDTWGFHINGFNEPVDETFRGGEWIVEERGPLRARVRMEGRLGRSVVRWTLTLNRNEPQLHLKLEINFSEKLKLLQMLTDLATVPESWTNGLAGGRIAREPGPTEWPVQGWSRVGLSGGLEVALVTSDAYSLSLDGARWQWTLLRSPKMAWSGEDADIYTGRNWHTDQGSHTFEFYLCVGEELKANVLNTMVGQQAQPPVVFDRYEGMDRPPWRNAPPRRLWTPAELRARAEGHMIHLVDTAEVGMEEDPTLQKEE